MLATGLIAELISWCLKNWKLVLIGVLISTIVVMKSCSDRKYEKLNSEFIEHQTQLIKDRETIITSVLQSQERMLNGHIEIIEGLRNDLQLLNDNFANTDASYNRLLDTLNQNRSILNQLSKDSLIEYTINISDSLGEIGEEAKLYAREADTSAREAEALVEMIENYRKSIQQLKIDLEAKGIKVNMVDFEEMKSK